MKLWGSGPWATARNAVEADDRPVAVLFAVV